MHFKLKTCFYVWQNNAGTIFNALYMCNRSLRHLWRRDILDWSHESTMFERFNEPQVLSMCRARCQDDAINISYIVWIAFGINLEVKSNAIYNVRYRRKTYQITGFFTNSSVIRIVNWYWAWLMWCPDVEGITNHIWSRWNEIRSWNAYRIVIL